MQINSSNYLYNPSSYDQSRDRPPPRDSACRAQKKWHQADKLLNENEAIVLIDEFVELSACTGLINEREKANDYYAIKKRMEPYLGDHHLPLPLRQHLALIIARIIMKNSNLLENYKVPNMLAARCSYEEIKKLNVFDIPILEEIKSIQQTMIDLLYVTAHNLAVATGEEAFSQDALLLKQKFPNISAETMRTSSSKKSSRNVGDEERMVDEPNEQAGSFMPPVSAYSSSVVPIDRRIASPRLAGTHSASTQSIPPAQMIKEGALDQDKRMREPLSIRIAADADFLRDLPGETLSSMEVMSPIEEWSGECEQLMSIEELDKQLRDGS
ncbi:MAG: hypothetical protein WB791_06805 [Waddliaceae bacterium]